MGWFLNGIFYYSGLSVLINPIFDVGFTTVFVNQRVYAALLNGSFVAVKRVPG